MGGSIPLFSLATSIIAALIGIFPVILFGIGGFLLYGGEVESNQIMGTIFQGMSDAPFPASLFIIAMLIGALGASMSTADSILLSIGQIFTRDIIYPYLFIGQKMQVVLSKIVMGFVLLGAFLIGLEPPKLMGDLALLSSVGLCSLVPTFLGFQWHRRSKTAAFISFISGALLMAYLVIFDLKVLGLPKGIIVLFVSSLTYLLASLTSRSDSTNDL